MLEFRIDIVQALKESGYNFSRLRKEKLIGEQTITNMKLGIVPGIKTLDTLCMILDRQPGDLVKYVAGEKNTKKSVKALQ